MTTTCRESVLLVAVGLGRYDTIIVNLRQRNEVVAGIGSTVERYAVVITETGIVEVLQVVLDGYIRLDLLAAVVLSTPAQGRTIESWTPRTVLVVGLITVPTHTELVLHLWQAHYLLPLQTAVILYANTFLLLLTALGGDYDYTVGSTATIKCGSSSTLQDGHRLNIVGVNSVSTVTEVVSVIERGTGNSVVKHRYTVNYVQWLVATANRAETTDYN